MAKDKTPISYGWWILLAGFILMFLGTAASRSLFRHTISISDTFDWSLAHSALPGGISGVIGFIAGLAIASYVDRLGPRRFIVMGFPLIGIGFVILSFVNAIWMLYVVSTLVGLGFGVALFIAPHTVIAHWFDKRRCFALALLMTGSVLGKYLITEPAIQDFVSSSNSNWSALSIGLVILVVCVPLALIIRNKPENRIRSAEEKIKNNTDEVGTDFGVREALNSKPFWLLTIAMALAGVASMIINSIATVFLIEEIDIWRSSIAISRFAPLFSLIGILLFGYLGDQFSKRYLLVLAVAIQSISMVILMTAGSIAQVYIYYLVLGIGSGTMPLMFAIRADYFGLGRFATIAIAMILISGIIGLVLSAGFVALSNWIFDVWENFHITFILSIFISLIAAIIYFFARPPKARGAD